MVTSCGPAGPQPKGLHTWFAQQCSADNACKAMHRCRQGQGRGLTLFDLMSQWTRARRHAASA